MTKNDRALQYGPPPREVGVSEADEGGGRLQDYAKEERSDLPYILVKHPDGWAQMSLGAYVVGYGACVDLASTYSER